MSRLFGWRLEIREEMEKILHLELSAHTEVKKKKKRIQYSVIMRIRNHLRTEWTEQQCETQKII